MIYDMGKALAMLHNVKLSRFELDENEDDWCRSVRNTIERWVAEIRSALSKALLLKLTIFE